MKFLIKNKNFQKGQSREGKLSARMANEENLWQILWKKAEAKTIWEQEPLFDFYTEGSKVIQFLINLTPRQAFRQFCQV